MFVSFIWFVSILAFLVYAASQKLVAFDPDGKLWRQSQLPNFDGEIAAYVSNEFGNSKNKVVHFSQNSCECNLVAQEHLASVEFLADSQGYENVKLVLGNNAFIEQYIPATPAVAVFNDKGSLTYLGPYSAGYSCTAGNGIVESYLVGQTKTLIGATVITNTEGCYCPVQEVPSRSENN